MSARSPVSASGNRYCLRLLFPIVPSWNEPSSETWSSDLSTRAERLSTDAVRSLRPTAPRTKTPSGSPWSPHTRSPLISGLADHSRERAFRAPLPPRRRAQPKRLNHLNVAHLNIEPSHIEPSHVEPRRDPHIFDMEQ